MKRIALGTVALATLLAGCASSETEVDRYIRSIDPLDSPPSQVVEGSKSAPSTEGDFACISQDFTETRQYDEIVAFSANSDSLWPGAILRGDSLYDGLFTQVVFDRNPLTFSVSLENLAGAKSAEMRAPALSAFRDNLGQILGAEVTGATPANISAEIEEVHSSDQLSVAIGAGVSWPGLAEVNASFNFGNQDVRSRYVVKFVQSYYTVDIDQPGNPSDMIAASVPLSEVEAKFGDKNPPVYVSSITYGRMVMFTFESELSATELGSALDFTYRGGADISGNVSLTYKEMISQSNITAYILGGSGSDAVQTIDGFDALKEFIKQGGDYSRDSPGAPIAYKLAYLADNSPARLSFVQDYSVKDCSRVSQKIRVTLDSITVELAGDEVGSGGDLELYGTISAGADNDVNLFDRGSNATLNLNENEPFTLPQGFIDEGILQVTPQEGNVITLTADLFDKDGLSGDDHFAVATFDASFETGWRRPVDLLISDGGARIRIRLSLEPI